MSWSCSLSNFHLRPLLTEGGGLCHFNYSRITANFSRSQGSRHHAIDSINYKVSSPPSNWELIYFPFSVVKLGGNCGGRPHYNVRLITANHKEINHHLLYQTSDGGNINCKTFIFYDNPIVIPYVNFKATERIFKHYCIFVTECY